MIDGNHILCAKDLSDLSLALYKDVSFQLTNVIKTCQVNQHGCSSRSPGVLSFRYGLVFLCKYILICLNDHYNTFYKCSM